MNKVEMYRIHSKGMNISMAMLASAWFSLPAIAWFSGEIGEKFWQTVFIMAAGIIIVWIAAVRFTYFEIEGQMLRSIAFFIVRRRIIIPNIEKIVLEKGFGGLTSHATIYHRTKNGSPKIASISPDGWGNEMTATIIARLLKRNPSIKTDEWTRTLVRKYAK